MTQPSTPTDDELSALIAILACFVAKVGPLLTLILATGLAEASWATDPQVHSYALWILSASAVSAIAGVVAMARAFQ